MVLGHLLRIYRQAHAIPLRSLAGSIGIDFSTLSRFERGRSVSGEALVKILQWILSAVHHNLLERK